MAYKTRAERAVEEGDHERLAQMIVADLMAALKVAKTTDERLRITAELATWIPKSGAPSIESGALPRPAAETRPATPSPVVFD